MFAIMNSTQLSWGEYCFENIVAIPMLYEVEQTHALEDYIETSDATKVDIAARLVASLPARQ